MDSTMSPKVTTEGEGVGACSLAHNTLREEEHVGASGMGLGRFINTSFIQTDLHKPNNKLVNA